MDSRLLSPPDTGDDSLANESDKIGPTGSGGGVEPKEQGFGVTATSNTRSGYPLIKITEPHETNDILLRPPSAVAIEENMKHLYETHAGNHRFDELVREYAVKYHSSSRMEKPVIAMRLLEHWRNDMDPPGRLLMWDGHFWNDVGNKNARERIGRALRRSKPQRSEQPTETTKREDEKTAQDGPPNKVTTTVPQQPLSALWKDGPSLGHEGVVLYGRESEQEELKSLYRRHSGASPSLSEPSLSFCMLSGATGTGKTALAYTLQPQVERDGGFFLQGKFESQDSLSIEPSAALVAVLTDLICQLVLLSEEEEKGANGPAVAGSRPSAVQRCRKAIQDELEIQDSGIFYGLLPALEKLIGRETDSDSDGKTPVTGINKGSLGDKRAQFVFHAVFRAVNSQGIPLVVVLDDLHWATDPSLDFLASVMKSISNYRYIFFVGTFRNNGTPAELEKLEQVLKGLDEGCQVTNVPLGDLGKDAVGHMLSDSLPMDSAEAEELCNYLYTLTQGNLLFLKEALRNMQENDLLSYNETSRSWTFDSHLVRIAEQPTSIEDLYRARILELPSTVVESLKVAACFGSTIDDDILSTLMRCPVLPHLQLSASKNLLVVDKANEFFRFSHDGVQHAAYNLIPEHDREDFHWRIGLRMWRKLSRTDLDDYIIVVLGQLMKGESLLKEEKDRIAVATLSLRAGEKIARFAGFDAALVYFRHGIGLLGERCWRDNYKLTLRLYNAAVEACYCTAQFDEVESLVGVVLANVRNYQDSLRARSTQIYALNGTSRLKEAVRMALDSLAELGETFPKNPTSLHVAFALRRLSALMKRKTDSYILRLPAMEDENKIAALQILNNANLSAFFVNKYLGPLFMIRMVFLSLRHGLCALSTMAFGGCGVLLASGGGNVEEGFRYGKLAMAIYDRYKQEAFLGGLTVSYYGCISCWKESFTLCLEPLKHAYLVGLRTGDISAAVNNAGLYCWIGFENMQLRTTEREIRILIERMEFFGQSAAASMILPLWQMVLNLLGHAAGNPCDMTTGSAMTHSDAAQLAQDVNPILYTWADFCVLMLQCIFGDFDEAENISRRCINLLEESFTAMDAGNVVFFGCLALLGQTRKSGNMRWRHFQARYWMRRLRRWALRCPSNFNGKLLFLEAELAAANGEHLVALSKYRSAIIDFRDAGFLMKEAMAQERLAKYHMKHNDDESSAAPCFREAIRLYKAWGAVEKVTHLENEMQAKYGIQCTPIP